MSSDPELIRRGTEESNHPPWGSSSSLQEGQVTSQRHKHVSLARLYFLGGGGGGELPDLISHLGSHWVPPLSLSVPVRQQDAERFSMTGRHRERAACTSDRSGISSWESSKPKCLVSLIPLRTRCLHGLLPPLSVVIRPNLCSRLTCP